MMRIGNGFDVHAFGDGDHVILGGVRIGHTQALVAHSDGDVVLHALCDALLGALALGDIGKYFPPSDERWRGANSRDLLRHCVSLIEAKGFALGNADITIICEQPKISPHSLLMQKNIAEDCRVSIDQVSVKATTTERLGFTGRGEGIAAQAVVLLVTR
jgi:2-C-methyl-D-erythritol 2,4-cyclodiphosphate synthase